MKSVSAREIQELDRIAIEQIGIPSLCLMENAGRSVAGEVLHILEKRKKNKVAVVCGLGNNAGDGFVAARHLINAGLRPDIFLIGPAGRLKQDAGINYRILKRCGYPVHEIKALDAEVDRRLRTEDVMIDAIFGVGLNRKIGEPFRGVIEYLNATGRDIIAVDVPSGLDATTGKIYGVCVRAAATVTFSYAKKGFYRNDGPAHTGKVIVADIGILKVTRHRPHGTISGDNRMDIRSLSSLD